MRITANQVTMARIILLPVPVYMLIYGSTVEWWIAFAIFVLLGATDFVDGLMARREGPTKLGSLIDPVADKIFIAAIILSMIALNIFPAWVACALLSREFLMTALRSSVATRKESMKTSMLGKLKTIVQMGGAGTIFLTIVLPSVAIIWVSIALSIPFLVTGLAYLAKRRRPPFWSFPVFLSFVLVACLEYFCSKEVNLMVQMSIILSMTWASAIDYLVGTYRIFKRTGMMLGDGARILWAVVFGVCIPPFVTTYPIIVLPVLVSISLEFGLGGIDNIVAAERGKFSAWPFFLSSSSGILFLGTTFFLSDTFTKTPFIMSVVLACLSAIICGVVFARYFDLFKRSL